MTVGPTSSGQPGTIVIRTHYLDDILLRRAESLQRGGDYEVVFAIDERRQEWDAGGFAKVSLRQETFAALGLFTGDPAFLWRFGDYVFYAVQQERPHSAFLWLLENDVAIDAADPAEPFRKLDAASADDLLASHVRPAEDGWFWYRSMSHRYNQVHRCFFPVVRLSRRAIEHLHAARVAATPSYPEDEKQGRLAPNDEVFAATVLRADGFSYSDFNRFGTFYLDHTLSYETLFNSHALPGTGGVFYHAALSGQRYLEKLQRLPSLGVDSILAALENDPQLDIGQCEPDFLRALDAALPTLPDGDDLTTPDSFIGRALALGTSSTMLASIARSLVEANKHRALARLKRDHDSVFAGMAGPFRNVTRGKPASQSSTCSWSRHQDPIMEAAGANNGDRLMECGCHTDQEVDPWWQVDLGTVHEIHDFEIVNRKHMADRLLGFRISASLDGRTWDVVHVDHGVSPLPHVFSITPDRPVRCRFLRLTVPGQGILHIVEFAAFGTS